MRSRRFVDTFVGSLIRSFVRYARCYFSKNTNPICMKYGTNV